MPADKLVLRNRKISSRFLKLAEQKGMPKGGYSHFVDLSAISPEFPVFLHCGGYHSGNHKITFCDVAHLGYTLCKEIAAEIFGDSLRTRIMRVDWCVDLDIPLLDLALYCRLGRAQNCCVERSRTGITFYLRRSTARTVMMYDKWRQLQAIRHPITKDHFASIPWTRVEVQFKSDLPVRRFDHLEQYAELNLLPNVSFWDAGRKQDGLNIPESLAAERFLLLIDEFGLQMASKRYSSQTWAPLAKKFLRPAPESKFPDLNELLRNSARDWLKDRIRFPRLPKWVQR